MVIDHIQYIPNDQFPKEPTDAPKTNYSMKLAFVNYAQDGYGNAISKGTPGAREASSNKDLLVRSYYTLKIYGEAAELASQALTFESIMQLISAKRARLIESEIAPMSDLIRARNNTLEQLQNMLGEISAGQAVQQKDRQDDQESEGVADCPGLGAFLLEYFTPTELKKVSLHGDYKDKTLYDWANANSGSSDKCTSTKVQGVLDACNSLVKAKIDYLNNETQTDMSRMNSLVQKRDESFQTAKELTSIVADGRNKTLRNLGG